MAALDRNPWDVVVAVAVIVVVALLRLVRRPSLYGVGIVVPALDLLTQLLLVVLGFALVFSPHALTQGTSLGTHPTWHSLAFALPLAMLAFTGLETVANLAAEARRPGVDLPRSVFGGDRDRRHDVRRDRRRRAVGVPGPAHRARRPVDPRAARSASLTASATSSRAASAACSSSTSGSPAR